MQTEDGSVRDLRGESGERMFKPIYVQNSRLPGILSLFAPVRLWSFTIPPFTFCEETLDDATIQHEMIHMRQWLELGIVGFVLLYPGLWALNVLRGMNKHEAYFYNPMEHEACIHESDAGYLVSRPAWAWLKYLGGKRNG